MISNNNFVKMNKLLSEATILISPNPDKLDRQK